VVLACSNEPQWPRANMPDWPLAFHTGRCGKLDCRRLGAEVRHARKSSAANRRRRWGRRRCHRGRGVQQASGAARGHRSVDRRGQDADGRRATAGGRRSGCVMGRATSILRSMWCPPAQQRPFSRRLPHTLWRCPDRQPASPSLLMPECGGSGDRIAATHADPRLCCPGAALPRGAVGVAGALRRRGRIARRYSSDRIRRQRHHAARGCPACGRACGGRTR